MGVAIVKIDLNREIIDSMYSSQKKDKQTGESGTQGGMERLGKISLVNRDGRKASCSESEKGDCGLALRF